MGLYGGSRPYRPNFNYYQPIGGLTKATLPGKRLPSINRPHSLPSFTKPHARPFSIGRKKDNPLLFKDLYEARQVGGNNW
jgi:hypothetical protein